jgi:hypothetical protein
LRRAGMSLALEPRAVVAEECFESWLDTCRANATYARMQAARRARSERWSRERRLINALVAPVVATAVKLARIWRGSKERRGEFIGCLPLVAVFSLAWALGESGGYLFGEGRAAGRFVHWELDASRVSM